MGTALTTLASGLDHPEGIAWDPALRRLVAGGEAGQVYVIDPNAGDVRHVADTGGTVLGITIDAAGGAYVCNPGRRAVLRVDLATGAHEVYASGFTYPNSLAFDAAGRLYVSDSGDWRARNGAIHVVEPGRHARVVTTAAADYTNGLALDPAGEHLYVVETGLPGVSRFRIDVDGGLGPKQLVVELPRTVPDGLAFTADGRLVITCYRPDRVLLFDGDLHVLADDWTGIGLSAPTNAAFFGDGMDRLVVANLAGEHLTEIAAGLKGAGMPTPPMSS